MKLTCASIAIALALASPAQARQRVDHTRHSSHSGFTCGLFMRQHTGNKYGPAFNLARMWTSLTHAFSPAPGVVVVQSRSGRALGGGPGGHVSMIVEVRDQCTALVRDNRGTYLRDICRNRLALVQP